MNGDYSRLTFDPSRNHSSVRMQQGRVLLDSDWNEQADLINRRTRAAIIDTFGRLHVASPEAFAISLGPGGLMIGRGRMYVDGLIAENHGAGHPVWDPALDELHGEGPTPYLRQPYLPDPPPVPASGGPYLVYLDVWQREITSIDDPGLTDPAVGADTTTRLQTVWQVRIWEMCVDCRARSTGLRPLRRHEAGSRPRQVEMATRARRTGSIAWKSMTAASRQGHLQMVARECGSLGARSRRWPGAIAARRRG